MLNTMQNTIPTTSGIYRIQIGPRTFYWGQAQNLHRRASTHRNSLARSAHANPQLQAAFDKHGADAFRFGVVLLCAQDNLDWYEQRLLDAFAGDPLCANIAKCAEAPMRGRKHTDESRRKMMGRTSPNKGRELSDTHRGRLSEAAHRRWQDSEARAAWSSLQACVQQEHQPSVRVTRTCGEVTVYAHQTDAAKALGVASPTVCNWLAGRKSPHPKHNIASIERVDKS